jgi:hypothetical protein
VGQLQACSAAKMKPSEKVLDSSAFYFPAPERWGKPRRPITKHSSIYVYLLMFNFALDF